MCFEVCALCLSSTMESSKLNMWQIWWNVDDIQRPVVLGFAYLCTVGFAIQRPSFKVIRTLYSSCAIVACLGKKLLVGCTSYLGI